MGVRHSKQFGGDSLHQLLLRPARQRIRIEAWTSSAYRRALNLDDLIIGRKETDLGPIPAALRSG